MSSSEQSHKRLSIDQESDNENAASPPKRLRDSSELNPNNETSPTRASDEPNNEFTFEALDSADIHPVTLRRYHSVIRFTTATESFTVRAGDSVYLTNDTSGYRWVYNIDRFFLIGESDNQSEPTHAEVDLQKNTGALKMIGSWFLRSNEVERLKSFEGFESIMDRMKSNEVVLSNIKEILDANFIHKICKVHRYDEDDKQLAQDIPDEDLCCRYMVTVDKKKKTLKWSAYRDRTENSPHSFETSEDDNAEMDNNSSHHDMKDKKEDRTAADDDGEIDGDDDDDDMSSDEDPSQTVMQEGEGSTLRGDIGIGPKYQIDIGPYDPNATSSVKSRNPKLVWKPNVTSDDELHRFFVDLALLHNKYLEENNLIILDEPYTPLRLEEAENLMREKLKNTTNTYDAAKIMLCGSCMSSASMLGASKSNPSRRNELFRECDADKVLEFLCDHNYNTEEAIEALRSNLYSITTAWNKREREIFDVGYRQVQSSALREISEVLKPTTKTLKDVIDYHYRFKITDQYRKYQNRKLEQAIHIVECIDSRRALNDTQHQSGITGGTAATKPSANGDGDSEPARNGDNQNEEVNWCEKTIASVAQARDNRVRAAKQLLMDVKEVLGADVMKSVALIIKNMQVSYDSTTRVSLFQLLPNQPELQSRFLEFLPRQAR